MNLQAEQGPVPSVTIGMVDYINVAPIYELWKESVSEPEWQVVEDVPAGLNRRLLAGEIDVGFVSSFACGLNPEKYLILPGLSISANGPVGSVFLFSHVPFEQLDGARVLLTSQSATSVALAKLLLEKFHNVQPEYVVGDAADAAGEEFRAVLAIGNQALKMVETSEWLYQFDLADIWKRQTELPFVFAVFAVRREFAEQQPHLLGRVHQELLRCQEQGRQELSRICELVAARIPIRRARCEEYLSGIQYDLSSRKRDGLEHFFQLLIEQKYLPESALPLQFFTPESD